MANTWSAPRSLRDSDDMVASLVKLEGFLRESSGLYIQPRKVIAATTLLGTDRLLLADTTAGAFTVTLLSAKLYLPQPYRVKLLAGANNVTLDADGTELIYTTTGVATFAWNTAGTSYTIIPCLVTAPGTWGWAVT